MNQVNINDENLVKKLGSSSCFGEVIILSGQHFDPISELEIDNFAFRNDQLNDLSTILRNEVD
jgi:hypothetical protein